MPVIRIDPINVETLAECENECCAHLRSILRQILKGLHPNTLITGGMVMIDGVAVNRPLYRPVPLEFGKFDECKNQDCCEMLKCYKKVYTEYLAQRTTLNEKTFEFSGHLLRSELLEIENKRLRQLLDQSTELLKHVTAQDAGCSSTAHCLGCTKVDNVATLLKSFSCKRDLELEKDRKQNSEINFYKIQAEDAKQINKTLTSRIMGSQDNLFGKDAVVSDLRKKLDEKDSIIGELKQNGIPAKTSQAVTVRLDQNSFLSAEAMNAFQAHPGVQSVARHHENAIFLDKEGMRLRQRQQNFGSASTHSSAGGDTTFEEFRNRQLEGELSQARSKIIMCEEIIAALSRKEAELEELKKKSEDQKEKVARRSPLKADLKGSHQCEVIFRHFFEIVKEGESCLAENTLYDTFFGGMMEQEKEGFMQWMRMCCYNGAVLPKREQKRMTETEKRSGKKLFAACLWAIGGIFHNSFQGYRCVWINIRMNTATKKRKVEEVV